MFNEKNFKLSIPPERLGRYVAAQLDRFFDDGHGIQPVKLEPFMSPALERLARCFKNIKKKYFYENGGWVFDHLHSDHYAMFLYLLGNTLHRQKGDARLAAKLFLLNKALHGLDAFYGIELPETFLFVHPVGTVLGRARYGNYFTVYQNCAVGAEGNDYPTIGEGVILYSRSSVLGRSVIGDNVILAANSFVLDSKIPSNSIVVGAYPDLRVLRNRKKSAKARMCR